MKAPSHSIAITNTTTTSMSTICTHTLEWVVGIGGSSHASWCVWHGNHCHFNTTFATHTTVTVVGGTAKQLLGSSTDWCATTIVTPHTRGATAHTHMDGKVVWCGQCVVTVVCINTCMVTSLCHTICVCHFISQVCVTIHSITPVACLSHTPF